MESNRYEIILHNILQELYNKTFDCNYNEFYNYITLEIGITDDEIDILRANNHFIDEI